MNPYTELLKAPLSEFYEFSKTQKGKEWNDDWYKRIKDLVVQAVEENQDRAEELMGLIS